MPDPSRIEEILLRIVASDDDADQKLSAVERRLRALNDQRARAKVEIDDAASSRIEEIRAELKRLGEQVARPSVHLDDIAARARIGELERELRRVSGTRHVRVDVSGGSGGLSAGLDRIKSDLSEIGQRAQSLPRWIAATLPLTIPLVGTLAQAAAGAGLLGIAAGGAATAFGVLGLAVKQSLTSAVQQQQAVTKAQEKVTAAEQAYRVAVETGTAAQQRSAQRRLAAAEAQLAATKRVAGADQSAAMSVAQAWKGVQSTFASVMSGGVRATEQGMAGILGAVRRDLPMLRGPFLELGQSIRSAFTSPEVRQALAQLIGDFGRLVRATAPLAGPITRGLISLGDILVNLARAAMPELVKLARQLSDWLGNIANKTQDQERLRATVDRLMQSFEAVWGVVVKLAGALGQLFNSQIARSALAIISVLAQVVGWVIQLTNHLGPLGQLIGAGLGIVFIVGKFSAWVKAIRDTLGVLGTLRKALFGVAEAEVAVDAAQGAGGGGLFGRLKGLFGKGAATGAAGTGEQLALDVGGGAAASGGGGLLAKLGGLLKSGLGKIGIGGAAAGAVGAEEGIGAALAPATLGLSLAVAGVTAAITAAVIKWHRQIGDGFASAWHRAVSLTKEGASQIASAASGGWHRAVTLTQQAGSQIGHAVSGAWNRAVTLTKEGGTAIGHAASTAWHGIVTAARAVGHGVSDAASAVMRAGEAAVAGAAGLVHSAASMVWHGLSSAARAVGAAVSSAASATMHAGASAVSATAGLVRNVASTVWHGITSALSAITGAVQGTARAVITAAGSAISGASRFVSGAASSVAHSVISAFDSVIGQAAHAGASIMNAVASGISGAAGSVYSAGKSVANFLAGLWPGSEPRDPSSPLRGLAHRGQAIMENLASGITGAPLHAALKRALGESITALAVHTVRGATPMVALPSAGLGNVTLPITTAAGQQATAGTGALVVHQHLEFKMLAAPDAAGKRVIAATVADALRRVHPQTPPVHA